MKLVQNLRIHRFNNAVALDGDGIDTVYLTADMARKLAEELTRFASDVGRHHFTASSLNTVEILKSPGDV